MKVLVTGASSGIGKDISIEYAKLGYDLAIVARDKKRLEELKELLIDRYKINVEVVVADLSVIDECKRVHKEIENVNILVNNAGFGDAGNFTKTSLMKEINMINTNIIGYHILTKLYLIDMKKVGRGQILNVASIAGFMPGPLMATYYATKAYVVSLSEAIREELNQEKSPIKISILCPGPVDTNFNKVANVRFKLKGATSEEVAKYAVKNLKKGKFYIVPKFLIKLAKISAKFAPRLIVGKVFYRIQKKKFEK